MKKLKRYFMIIFFLAVFMPGTVRAAGSGSGVLTVDKNEVAVSLNIPEGKTENITTLRMWLRVTLNSGTMDEPAFSFDESIQSVVKDAVVQKEEDGKYLVDLIISGKKGQSLFQNSESAKIGRVSLKPGSKEYQITVEIAGEMGSTQEAAARYVDSNGLSAMLAPLADTAPAVVKNESAEAYNKTTKLKTSILKDVKKGTYSVVFKWKSVSDADGYQIYEYDGKTKKYKSIATIKNAKVTAYSKKYGFTTSHMFKIRPYQLKPDNSKLYGNYSPEAKITVPPAQVKSFQAKRKSAAKASLSWKKVSGAKGYQIYRSTKRDGKYTLVKTIKKGTTEKCSTIKQKNGTVYYYRIRAYVTNAGGKDVYGAFSAIRAALPETM